MAGTFAPSGIALGFLHFSFIVCPKPQSFLPTAFSIHSSRPIMPSENDDAVSNGSIDDDLDDLGNDDPLDAFEDNNGDPPDPRATRHLEIDAIHPALHADDSCRQTDIAAAVTSPWVHLPSERDAYLSMPTVPIPLSRLEDYYINRRSHSAADLLRSRIKIIVDAKYSLDPRSDHVQVTTPTHRLDYRLTVSDRLGLSAIIPNQPGDHNFSFRLDLRKPYRHFNDNSGLLGFDPAGSMLFIGYRGQDEAWLAMAPHTIDDPTELPDPGFKSGPTLLSRAHYRMIISFLAFVLAKNTDLSFICYDTYGIDLTAKAPAFQDYFSILFVVYSHFSVIPADDVSTLPRDPEYPTIEMRLEDLTLMDVHMSTDWDEWVARAPDAWREDGWLESHIPITLTCKFGQDQPIGNPNQADIWEHERDYSKIRFLSFALASDLRAQIAERFDNIPTEQIIAENQDLLYDSWDPDLRNRIRDLDALPLVDEDGNEVRIYDEEGCRVLRRFAVVDVNQPACGVLLNLSTCEALFNLDPSQLDDGECPIHLSLYPQAYLRSVGHAQANGILPDFQVIVNRLNDEITRPDRADDQSDDDDEEWDEHRRPPALRGVKFQAYNEMVHRFTDRHGGMRVQRGAVTAAAAGRYARDAKDCQSATKTWDAVKTLLPHEHMSEQLSPANCPRDLRLEQVYNLDLHRLPEERRNGRYIYTNIIVPLTKGWEVPAIASQLKQHLSIYTSDAYPALFDWVTYPVQAMLESAWQTVQLSQAPSFPSPYMIEVIAVLERALAYAYTGSAKLLSRSLMQPLFTSRALVDHGFPMLSQSIVTMKKDRSTNKSFVSVSSSAWPWNQERKAPATCSDGAQSVYYSKRLYNVSTAFLISFWVSGSSGSIIVLLCYRFGDDSLYYFAFHVYSVIVFETMACVFSVFPSTLLSSLRR
ncbi:hypothetical protein BS47DRAFT_1391881 [Hydnum rufescens UP504]|uniref:DUF8190 domain-containing protein n=1 Tax=Hydnum rufescens UP504 TaxID=1448309 RepID=A0A9P6AZZ7_9AGAM|nr:hypothetical protein BS47DRAFT_1391881 [Hydnum rufescens UP504]